MDSAGVTFYFDPISPYSWLASKALGRIAEVAGEIAFQPVLFAGLLNAHGQRGPAEIAAERRYMFRDVLREATRAGLPFAGPPGHPFNSLQARIARDSATRAAGLPTVPSTIGIEKATNPFLRYREPAIIDSLLAADRIAPGAPPLSAFAALREWKNVF